MLEEAFREAVGEAIRSGERRLLLAAGEGSLERLASLLWEYGKELGRRPSVLYSADYDRRSGEVRGADLVAKLTAGCCSLTVLDFDRSDEAVGGTWDVLLADLGRQMRANDLGRLVETVRGGGLVLFAIPGLRTWLSTLTYFQAKLATPPYSEADVRNRFKKRMLKTLERAEGAWIVDLEAGEVRGNPREISERRETPRPDVDEPVRRLALTEEQLEVIDAVDGVGRRGVVVVTANRGRGKSAACGLALSLLIGQRRVRRAVLTAPQPQGLLTLTEFLERGLRDQGIEPRVVVRDGLPQRVLAGRARVDVLTPVEAAGARADLVVVDEAAGIPVPLLFKILGRYRISVFSSTIHGYEGAGRGFSLRFMGFLRRSGLRVTEVRMTVPIRYPPGDPIEAWLYDFLLLDAEPPDPPEEPDPSRAEYGEVDLADDSQLRPFYGIYVLAHYRNRPNDLAILLDAPHHMARALTQGGRVVVSLHVAEEGRLSRLPAGELPPAEGPPGHMIPNRVALYYGHKEFMRLWGWRIVRIATHPDLQGMGFGTRALSELEEEARERGVDWIGAGFGATARLLRFWVKNGFLAVHASPKRNEVSGEYSVFVVKPLSERAGRAVTWVNQEFRRRMIGCLHDTYFDMSPAVARLLLRGPPVEARLRLSQSQRVRLTLFMEGTHNYDAVADAAREVVAHYFTSWRWDPPLDEREEEVLLAKALQGKPWETVASRFKLGRGVFEYVKDALRRLVEEYEERRLLRLWG